MPARRPRRIPWGRLSVAMVLSLLVNAGFVELGRRYAAGWALLGQYTPAVKVTVLSADPLSGDEIPTTSMDAPVKVEPRPEEKVEELEPPEKKELPDGQIVDVPAPLEEKVPTHADYLAEHNNAVPEETRTRDFKINPEILANRYSDESRMELRDSADVAASQYSTGARAGGTDAAEKGTGAPRSAIPSQYAFTNKEGLAAPVAASSSRQAIAGAPQNDLLDEKLGREVSLNTREFIGAAYLNRIRRQVNYYWRQCLDNTDGMRLTKNQYDTWVDVVLTGEGALDRIEVTRESGLDPLDNCVVQAFRIAGPFPNPPEALIQRDGRIYLPDIDFAVSVGVAEMQFEGIDPRGNVQFPGILNAPR